MPNRRVRSKNARPRSGACRRASIPGFASIFAAAGVGVAIAAGPSFSADPAPDPSAPVVHDTSGPRSPSLVESPRSAPPSRESKLAPDLLERIARSGGEAVPAVVLFETYPTLESISTPRGADARAHVVAKLRDVAARSQGRALDELAAERTGNVSRVRSLWGINAIALHAPGEVLERLARLSEVRRVFLDFEPDLATVLDGPTGADASGPAEGAGIAPQLSKIGADRVWRELGYTGDGAIVAIIDEGVDVEHPDLADHLWTNLAEIEGNGIDDDGNGLVDDLHGWDFCGDDPVPFPGSHGTRVAGELAGDGTGGMVTGVAPDAEIMVLDVRCGGVSNWWRASEYAIEQGAHIVSQSLSAKWTQEPDYEAFRRQTDAELAAGVIHVNSAGNTGRDRDKPVPYNLGAPANSPPPWPPEREDGGRPSSVLAVANVSLGDGRIAGTSALGPSAWEDVHAHTDPDFPHGISEEYRDFPYANGAAPGLAKPDLAAYGAKTRSTCPGGGYCSFAGTSAAAPNVAGVLALARSANPAATPAELARAVLATARPLAATDRLAQGAGLVDAFAAVREIEVVFAHAGHVVLDDGPGGDGDGAFDGGETVELSISLENTTRRNAFAVRASLISLSDVAVVERAAVRLPPARAGAVIRSSEPGPVVRIRSGACGEDVSLALDLELADGRRRIVRFGDRVGRLEDVVLLETAFEGEDSDDWATAGSASTGGWELAVPIATYDASGNPASPEADATADGRQCHVTGNGHVRGRPGPQNNDVDGGDVTLVSPWFGLPGMERVELRYTRWFYAPDARPTNDRAWDAFTVEIERPGSSPGWQPVDAALEHLGRWERRRVALEPSPDPEGAMRLRFTVRDFGADGWVEGGLDDVVVDGVRLVCDEL